MIIQAIKTLNQAVMNDTGGELRQIVVPPRIYHAIMMETGVAPAEAALATCIQIDGVHVFRSSTIEFDVIKFI